MYKGVVTAVSKTVETRDGYMQARQDKDLKGLLFIDILHT